jgi:hypothetical protein
MIVKVCKKCGIEKDISEFDQKKGAKDGHTSRCKICRRNYFNEYNNTPINLIRRREKSKENYWKNHENELKKASEKHKKNSEQEKEYRKNNRKKISQREKNRYHEDVLFRIKTNMRNRLKLFLKSKNLNKKNTTLNIVGADPKTIKEYIEQKFTDGMSWENYRYDGWHIDHIIPLSSAKTEEEIYKLSHYTNLQPLWAEENLKKRNKIV